MNRNFQRPQDKMYEDFMRCDKSYDNRHHFVPVKTQKKDSNQLQCSHCGVAYDATLHNPPDGYKPQ
jgi:hypothetical protein